MITEITLIVCATALGLMFVQEITRFFKKIAKIPGLFLVTSLLLASWLVETYSNTLEWIGWVAQTAVILTKNHITHHISVPHDPSLRIVQIAVLIVVITFPTLILQVISRYKRYPKGPHVAFCISLIAWVTLIFLLGSIDLFKS